MAYGDVYGSGTVTLDDTDSKIVHGTGTSWLANVTSGDTFTLDGNVRGYVADIVNDLELHLLHDWPASDFTDETYSIVQDSPKRNPPIAVARSILDTKESLRAFRYSKPIFGLTEFGVNAPPIDYAVDEMLVVGMSPSGDFAGHANEIARWTEGAYWHFLAPEFGWHVIAETDPSGPNLVRSWDGAAWQLNSGLASGISFSGLWDVDTSYGNGDVVSHEMKFWIALRDTVGDEPGTSPDDWIEYPIPGEHGGIPMQLRFLTDTAATTPGSGNVKLNGAPGAATLMRISRYDAFGGDWASFILGIASSTTSNQKGKVRLQTIGNQERVWYATVMGVVAAGAGADEYYNLTLSSPALPNETLENNAPVLFYFQERGDVGATGNQGIQGLRGFPGGPIAITYTIDLTGTADVDPGNGNIRFGPAASQAAATVWRVDSLSAGGASVATLLASLATASTSDVKAIGRIFLASNPEIYMVARITAVATPSGYRNITVEPIEASSGNPFVQGDAVILAWIPKGDKGDAGTLAVGTVTTGAAGTDVIINNSGTPQSAVLDITIPRGDPGESFDPDAFVDEIADRDAYDDEPAGFSVVVHSDSTHSDAPWLYAKASNASADWTAGHLWGLTGVAADAVTYDNTESELEAENVQDAVDEVNEALGDMVDPFVAAIVMGD